MKKALSLMLVLILCLSLCACRATQPELKDQTDEITVIPQTVVLTEDNFYQYFDVEYSIHISDFDTIFNSGYMQGSVAIATAEIKVVPKFTGTWSDFKADILWTVRDYVWGYWTNGPYESKCVIEQPDVADGGTVETIVCTENYKSGKISNSSILYDDISAPKISTPTVENVSGVIVVERMK